ncbi:MAG: hypothetical protein WAW52_10545 [Methanothrix sp.]
MKARFAVALLAIAMLCACALAQEETAEDWSKKGQELRMNGSLEEALDSPGQGHHAGPEKRRCLAVQGPYSKGP